MARRYVSVREIARTEACHPDIQDVRASFDILGKPKMLPLLMENFLGEYSS